MRWISKLQVHFITSYVEEKDTKQNFLSSTMLRILPGTSWVFYVFLSNAVVASQTAFSLQSLLFTRQGQHLSCQMLQNLNDLCAHLPDTIQCVCLFCTSEPRTRTQNTHAKQRAWSTSLKLLSKSPCIGAQSS